MEATRLQREQPKSEPVSDRARPTRAPAPISLWPLTLNDAHSPALRLGHGFERSHAPATNGLQAKLTTSKPGDQYEQEADRVAEQVMRMPDPAVRLQRNRGCGGSSASPKSCEVCGSPPLVQRKAATPDTSVAAVPHSVHDVLRSPGQPLNTSTRASMEARFGHDFRHVRIHADSHAATASDMLNARAFTVGRHVVFGPGQYQPGTSEGKKLLAHELTHVVQQDGGRGVVQRAAPAVPVVAAGVSVVAILEFIAFVGSAILAAYLIIQAYEAARRSGIGVDLVFQTLLAAISRILAGAGSLVRVVNNLLERASRIARKPPGCNEAIQQLSVLIIQFEMLLGELSAEIRAEIPRLHIVRELIQQMESLLPEIGMWMRIVARECFPLRGL